MQRPLTIYGLQAKRKELRWEIAKLLKAIRAIDIATGLFTEEKPKGAGSERQRFIFAYIREHGIVTAGDVTAAWLAQQTEPLSDARRKRIRIKIGEAFNKYEGRGLIACCGKRGTAKLWKLAGES